ncbi:MAG: cytochrome P450 [Chloroflexota bacterium]|nr:MAG: cytochrome P450 [Chloroflexota bacterium]
MIDSQSISIPTISSANALPILKVLTAQRSLLAGMAAMHNQLGDIFEISFPGFAAIVLTGSTFAREVLVTSRQQFEWRNDRDPVTGLLRHGVLVEDGHFHDTLRGYMEPTLRRSKVGEYLPAMLGWTDEVISKWGNGSVQDMLVEMRRLALLILMDTLFAVDMSADLPRLWGPILRILSYISPGLWLMKPELPRFGYQKSINEMDEYLFSLIRERRLNDPRAGDLLSELVCRQDMTDDLIRDQLLTMLIAGHDTSTALLSWALYLLAAHPDDMTLVQQEVDQILGEKLPSLEEINQLHYLDQVVKEALRLYPPIHVGNRLARADLALQGCPVPRGRRIMVSYYLTHRDQKVWQEADRFQPQRFDRSSPHEQPPFSYLPFGGGPRNCIGAAFAQVEAKAILARILQTFDLELAAPQVKIRMGATLEPQPGVLIKVRRRNGSHVVNEQVGVSA